MVLNDFNTNFNECTLIHFTQLQRARQMLAQTTVPTFYGLIIILLISTQILFITKKIQMPKQQSIMFKMCVELLPSPAVSLLVSMKPIIVFLKRWHVM